jgi:hypothetical protein
MDTLQLPLLQFRDTIVLALERMREADTRAIVVAPLETSRGDYKLQMNTAILRGYKEKVETVGQLRDPGIDLPDYTEHPLFRGGGLDRPGLEKGSQSIADGNPGLQRDIESLFNRRTGRYFVAGTVKGRIATATIVTRHEGYAENIRNAAKVCICDGPGRHDGDAPPHVNGDPCEWCSHHYICR